MKRVGIAITTRNRPEVLRVALKHFEEFWPVGYFVEVHVIDDRSDEPHFTELLGLCEQHPNVIWHFMPNRLGVAKAKNKCLQKIKHCDYMFLFDDDCFPINKDWVDQFVNAHNKYGVNHILHIEPRPECVPIREIGDDLLEFRDAAGVLLFLTPEVIKKVGGFNKNFGTWGYEHLEYSRRIFLAGLNGDHGKYVALANSKNFIYSLDISNSAYFGNTSDFRQPPLEIVNGFRSSTDDAEKHANMAQYSSLFNSETPIYQELE